MNAQHRKEIATLVNRNNNLQGYVDSGLYEWLDYVYVLDAWDTVIAAARVQVTNWYNAEITHVVVRQDWRGKGISAALMTLAERRAVAMDRPVVSATTRQSNFAAQVLFFAQGYNKVCTFRSPMTGYKLVLWQKAVKGNDNE